MDRRPEGVTRCWRLFLVLVGGLWVCSSVPVVAQSAGGDSTADRGTERPLGRALEQLATGAEVSLVYDADLVRGHDTGCPIDEEAPEATLQCLLAESGLDFVQTSGGTYVIKEDVRRPPQHGAVKGVVRDAGTGARLSQVHVQVGDGETGVVTDRLGRFYLSGLVAGRDTLVVSHLGYETSRVEVAVSTAEVARATITLTPTSIAVAPVIVDAPTAEDLASSRRHGTLSPDQLKEPGSVGTPSVAHAAGTLMGITTQAPYADLHVQGGASSDHEVRLDGVPVRNPATAGRLLGAFSPLALDGLTARKAGFGALQGDVLSGIIELEHDLRRRDVRYASVRIDPVSLNGRVEGTVRSNGAPTTVMAAGRLGLWDVHRAYALSNLIDTWSVLDPVLTAAQLSADTSFAGGTFSGQEAHPRSQFYDVHGAARMALDSTRHLYLSAYRGSSTLGVDLRIRPRGGTASVDAPHTGTPAGAQSIPSTDRYEWTNTVAQARYEVQLSSGTTGRIQGSLSRYRSTSQYEIDSLTGYPAASRVLAHFSHSPVDGWSASNAVTEARVAGTLDMTFDDRTRLTLLGSATTTGTDFRLANAFVGGLLHSDRTARFAVATQAEMGLGRFTTVEGGLRLTARPDRGGLYLEPRAAVRYERPRADIGRLAARVGGGLYRRYTTQFELSRDGATAVVPTVQVWMPVPAGLDPPRTYHLAGDLTWSPRPSWTVALEGYAKWQPHLLAVDYPRLRSAGDNAFVFFSSQVFSASRGRAFGGGVDLSYEGAGGTATLRYSYTRARRTFPGRFDGRMVPAPWSEPHRLTLKGQVPLGDIFAVNLRGNGIWGRRWGYRRAYYAYLSPDDVDEVIDLNRPGQHVLPPLYRVDAGLEARHSWGNVEVTGRVGLVNILGRKNVADWGLQPANDGTVTRWPRVLPGRRSVVSLQVRY